MTSGSGKRSRRLLPMLGALVITAAVGVLVPASPAFARTDLEVTTPADGRYVPGSSAALIITIQADRAVEGTLVATFEGFRAGSQRVEVPGGSAKEVVMIASVPPWVSAGSVTFETGNDEDDASARVALTPAGSDELVAVLPSLATGDLPATADLAPLVGDARFYPLDPALLDAGSELLSTFSQLLVSADDLNELDEPQLSAIEGWVGAAGGVLVVDEDPGTALPLELTTGSETGAVEVPYGIGRLRYTSGEARAGEFEGLIRPTASRSPDEFPWGGWGSAPSTMQLARDAGVRVPALGSMLAMLGIYTLLAGPILWLLLRRGRREPLLWIAGPALALAATLGVYAFGRSLRQDTSSAHATLMVDLPTLRIASTQVLVTSPNGSSEGVHLTDGWRPVQISSDEFFFRGPGGFGGGGQAVPTLQGDNLVTDLPPGGVGVVAAEQTQPVGEPSWQFDLTPDGNDLTGTVTNLSGHDLEEVYVSSGQGFQQITELAAGDSAEVTLGNVVTPPIGSDRLMERLFQEDPWSANDSAVNAGVLSQWLTKRPLLRTPGFVLAVGWTRDESGPLMTTRGAEIDAGRTAFLSVDRVETSAGGAAPIEFLRGWGSTTVTDLPAGGVCTDMPLTLKMAVPEGATVPVLAVATRTVAALDLWTGQEWLPAGMADTADLAQEGEIVFALPPSALSDGSLYLRLMMSCDMWSIAEPFPELRASPDTDDLVIEPGTADEIAAVTAVDDLAAIAGAFEVNEDGTVTRDPDLSEPPDPTTTAPAEDE